MRSLLPFSAIVLAFGLASPATAQMCGGAGGMCSPSQAQMQSSPMTGQAPATTPDQSKPQMAGGCECCKHMAMMRPQGGSSMPGMDMPKQ